MLTGLFPPTSGDAVIYDKSIRNNLDEIRRFIGVCPQYNNIWEDLTVKDHLIISAGSSHR